MVCICLLVLVDGCAPRSRVRHAKIGEELDEAPDKADVPAPPPPAPMSIEKVEKIELIPTPNEPPAAVEVAEVPTALPTPEAIPTAMPETADQGHLVKHGDTLWDISSEPDIYGNSFLWPLIFRSNRDKILDPDLIYPRQELKINKGFEKSDMDTAIENSKKTPPYEPHRKPRKELPLNY